MGSYGVWLFFCLSGFLIIRILHRERLAIEAGRTTLGEAVKRFFWRRTLRIMPTYYLVVAVFAVLGAFRIVDDFRFPDAWWHLGYLSNVYFGEVVGRWAGRFGYFWSLAVEEQFYLLAAPVLLLTPSRLIRGLCGALVLAALAHHLTMRLDGASEIQVYTNSLVNFGALAFGGVVALALPANPDQGVNSLPALTCLTAIVATIYAFTRLSPHPGAVTTLIDGLPMMLTTVLAAAALAGIYLNQSSRLVAALEWAPLAGVGRISYGLYLYHNLMPHWLLTTTLRRFGWLVTMNEPVEATLMFAGTFLMAVLSWRFIERPLLALKDRPRDPPAAEEHLQAEPLPKAA